MHFSMHAAISISTSCSTPLLIRMPIFYGTELGATCWSFSAYVILLANHFMAPKWQFSGCRSYELPGRIGALSSRMWFWRPLTKQPFYQEC